MHSVGTFLELADPCLIWISLQMLIKIQQQALKLYFILAPIELIDSFGTSALDFVKLKLGNNYLFGHHGGGLVDLRLILAPT